MGLGNVRYSRLLLGTASGAQNIGVFGAIGVGAYIALAGSGEVRSPVRR